jgi:hypothetical protein
MCCGMPGVVAEADYNANIQLSPMFNAMLKKPLGLKAVYVAFDPARNTFTNTGIWDNAQSVVAVTGSGEWKATVAKLKTWRLTAAHFGCLCYLRSSPWSVATVPGEWTDNSDFLEPLVGRNLFVGSTDFRKTNLSFTDLTGAGLVGADLRDANLEFANLARASLTRANARGAGLRQNIVTAYLGEADLTAAGRLTV